jgi:programmed cell death 6-interacting protein
VFDRAHQLDTQVSRTLEELHLPAALDALDKPIGLPPSLIRKAEEVRLGDGPRQIEAMLTDIQALASNVASTLEEVSI